MKLVKLLLLIIGTSMSIWLTMYLYQEGYLTDYWDEHGQIDPQDRQPPCSVMTLAGQRFGERRIAKCVAAGGDELECAKEAWEWVYAMRPEERAKAFEKPKGSISERSQ